MMTRETEAVTGTCLTQGKGYKVHIVYQGEVAS